MQIAIRTRSLIVGLAWMACLPFASANGAPWVEVDPASAGLLDAQGQLLSSDGSPATDRGGRRLIPACSLGPTLPEGRFKFFTQAGDPAKLLIVHDGGGACWESNTCGSILVPNPNPAQVLFDPIITERAEDLPLARGVFDETRTDNPFRGWTKVYIPYCTGDIGWGNQVTEYPTPGGPLTIHHRGYANVRTTLEWIARQYAGTPAPSNVAMSGISAGGYAVPGAVLPEMRRLFPALSTRMSVLADSANGIVTDEFLQQARENWGYEQTLPQMVVDALAGGAYGLSLRFYQSLATSFPGTRLGQFQNAYDLNQATFYNVMLNVNEPFKWFDPQYLLPSAGSWSLQARLSVAATAHLPNYRFYTAAGTEHTITLSIPPEAGLGICSDEFYTENSAGGRLFRRWMNDMTNSASSGGSSQWRNAGCFPNCVAAPLPGCGF